MPLRKKARTVQATSPDPPSPTTHDSAILSDPWTDEEEIGLYKAIMRWKPTGIHKHFRLMALHAWLLEKRYIHPANAHTRPAGIWAKLNTLYDLPALDAMENARQLPKLENPLADKGGVDVEEDALADADAYSEADNKIDHEEFDPSTVEGVEEQMWKRRLPSQPGEADEDGDSEPVLPEVNLAEEPPVSFVPSFSIEPSEAATPSRKGKGARRGSGKPSEKSTRRSARQAESVAGEEEGSEGEQRGEPDARLDVENELEEESGGEEGRTITPAPRSTRAKNVRGKTSARGRGRGRGRSKLTRHQLD